MTTKQLQPGACSGTETPPSGQQLLLVDLLLEIVARSDVATVLRSAAASKTLRRAILEPSFRRHSSDPALLLAVSFGGHYIIHTPPSPRLRLAAGLLQSSYPVASRDGLRDRQFFAGPLLPELRVCDTLTGDVTTLPPVTVDTSIIYTYAVLTAGRSFQLLVADDCLRLRTQVFCSQSCRWGAVREASLPPDNPLPRWSHATCRPAVIGRTVYWPCRSPDGNIWIWDRVVALDADSGEATVVQLPPSYSSRMMALKTTRELFLAPVNGRLGFLVAEAAGISVWTLDVGDPAAAAWRRRMVIGRPEIERQAGLDRGKPEPFYVKGFGERSGALILQVKKGEIHRLNLGTTDEEPRIVRLEGPIIDGLDPTNFFLHEVDCASLLQSMKCS